MSLHFLSQIAQRLARRLAAATQVPAHATDPIDHPAIAAMDLRAIADLPLAQLRSRIEAPPAERPAARQVPRSAAA
jgi:hypothetical protein